MISVRADGDSFCAIKAINQIDSILQDFNESQLTGLCIATEDGHCVINQ